MDWLEFRPWSREVERFCRTCLEETRPPHPPDPSHAHPSERLREYMKVCVTLTEISVEGEGEDDAPAQRLA